jgi:hypothetical protein
MPVSHGKPTTALPIQNAALSALAVPFLGRSVGEMYLGPGWVDDAGVACVVFVAYDFQYVRRVRDSSQCAALAWRWNDAPSVPFSLTVMLPSGSPRPQVRWFRPSDDPVVKAIRREARLLMTVVNTRGQHSGWFDAYFHDSTDASGPPSRHALEYLWTFDTTGIPFSKQGARFDPLNQTSFNTTGADQIPLWADPISDFWRTLKYEGPWAEDLTSRDHAIAAWGYEAWRHRYRAAGRIQVLIDRMLVDGHPSFFDEQGRLLATSALQQQANRLTSDHPTLAEWLAAVAGPHPDAATAHEAVIATLNNPEAAFAVVDQLIGVLLEVGDDDLMTAIQTTFEAALLDARTTRNGTCRPWLANTGRSAFTLNYLPIDLDSPIEDIRELWCHGFEIINLIDSGLRLTPSDFPVPFDQLCQDLSTVAIEGSVEDAESRVDALLAEAQEARQWSVPWGARIEVQFGPFIAVRIFELDGEFSCHFLDDQDRYFHVAIGLRGSPPRAATQQLIRLRQDDGEPVWNDDAEVSLKLIGAAIVRDFLVVEERQGLFGTRNFRKRIRGRNLRTIIYLPRVRYSTPHPDQMPLSGKPAERVRHSVSSHLRRAKTASAAQRFLAQRYGMQLPQGFTFVRPHERGSVAEEARIRIYRSRSASEMIFEVVNKAPAGTRPAWFDFEKDCARLLTAQGMRVIHQAAMRDGDGGVDLYAVDALEQSWVVQCKCWAAHRAVGPDVVRELQGAIQLADKGASSVSKGMIITTSTFTDGASVSAAELGFLLIDGVLLRTLLAEKPS